MKLQAVISDTVLIERNQSGQPWLYPEATWSWNTLGGISIYVPLVEDDWKRQFYNAQYFQMAADGQWDEFLTAYWGEDAAIPPAPSQPGAPQIPLEQRPMQVYLPIVQR
jgi:ABC-type amino acid transport substrate-binding protein